MRATTRCQGLFENEWDDHIVAQQRLAKIESQSVDELASMLRARDVPVSESKDKKSLVRKVVVVTDRQKGHTSLEQLLSSLRRAPGADLRDRSCSRGAEPLETTSKEHRDITRAYSMLVGMVFGIGDFHRGCEVAITYWRSQLDLLQRDLE